MEFEKLQSIIAGVMQVDADEITMDTNFREDLGTDSLDLFQIVMDIENEFEIEIPMDSVESIETVKDAVDAIKNIKA